MASISKKDFNVSVVLRKVPQAFLYYVIGSLAGVGFGFVLFNINKNFLEAVLNLWKKRLLFGVEFIGEGAYTFWFIINNLAVMLVVVVASVFILIQVSREPRGFKKRFKRFRRIEKRRPKITLFGLYMVPIGALLINGFLISMFATYIFLNYGLARFTEAVMLLVPHGINEIIALVLACSLGLSYLKIMKPLILKGRAKDAIKTGKLLLKTDTTFYIVVIILMLVIFSGFLEGVLGTFVL